MNRKLIFAAAIITATTSSAQAQSFAEQDYTAFLDASKKCSCKCQDSSGNDIKNKDGDAFWVISGVTSDEECGKADDRRCRNSATGDEGKFYNCSVTYIDSDEASSDLFSDSSLSSEE